MVGGGDASVDGYVQQGLHDVLLGGASAGAGADVHGNLGEVFAGGKDGEGEHGAFALADGWIAPEVAPGGLGDHLLELAVEIIGSGEAAVDVVIAEYLAAGL